MGNNPQKNHINDTDTISNFINTLQSKKEESAKQNLYHNTLPTTNSRFSCCLNLCSISSEQTRWKSGKWRQYLLNKLNQSNCRDWPQMLIILLTKDKASFACSNYQQDLMWIHINSNTLRYPTMEILVNKISSSDPPSFRSSLIHRYSDSCPDVSQNIVEEIKEEYNKLSSNSSESQKISNLIQDIAILEENIIEAQDCSIDQRECYDLEQNHTDNSAKNNQKRLQKANSKLDDFNDEISPKEKLNDQQQYCLKKENKKALKRYKEYKNNTFINTISANNHQIGININNDAKFKGEEIITNINHYKLLTSIIEKHLNDTNNIFSKMIHVFNEIFIERYKHIITDEITPSTNAMNTVNTTPISNVNIEGNNDTSKTGINEDEKKLKILIKSSIQDICEFIHILYETLSLFYDFDRIRYIDKKIINHLFNKNNLINFLTSILFNKTKSSNSNFKSILVSSSSLESSLHINMKKPNNEKSNHILTQTSSSCKSSTLKKSKKNVDIYTIMIHFFSKQSSSIEANFQNALNILSVFGPEKFGIEPRFCLNEESVKCLNGKNQLINDVNPNSITNNHQNSYSSKNYATASLSTNLSEKYTNLIENTYIDPRTINLDSHIENKHDINSINEYRIDNNINNNNTHYLSHITNDVNKKSGYIPYSKAINVLKTLDEYHSPLHKLKVISKVVEIIYQCINEYYYDNYGINDMYNKLDGDQTLSIFMYLISKSKLYTLPSQCDFIHKFVTSNIMNSVSGYYLTTLEASISCLIAMADGLNSKPN